MHAALINLRSYLQRCKDSIGFTPEHEKRLAGVATLAKDQLPGIVKKALDEIEVSGPGECLQLGDIVESARQFLSGPWDDSYEEDRQRMASAWLEARIPVQALTGFVIALVRQLTSWWEAKAGREGGETVLAIHKAAMLDLQLLQDAYVRLERTSPLVALESRARAHHIRRIDTLAALGALTSGLAHEIRNPLNSAQLQLALVDKSLARADEVVAARGIRASSMVKRELTRLAGLVNDFLAFARPSPLHVQETDLTALCRRSVEALSAVAGSKGIRLTHSIESGLVTMLDKQCMEQVIRDLVQNAIEATEGTPRAVVDVGCCRRQDCFLVEITDNGQGLPENIDIFEPFTTTKEGGTGLGLPIAQRGVVEHGGRLSIVRQNDRTICSVELPLALAHQPRQVVT